MPRQHRRNCFHKQGGERLVVAVDGLGGMGARIANVLAFNSGMAISVRISDSYEQAVTDTRARLLEGFLKRGLGNEDAFNQFVRIRNSDRDGHSRVVRTRRCIALFLMLKSAAYHQFVPSQCQHLSRPVLCCFSVGAALFFCAYHGNSSNQQRFYADTHSRSAEAAPKKRPQETDGRGKNISFASAVRFSGNRMVWL